MSFYEPQGWQDPVRQASWEQPPPPSRSETSSVSQREESNAFAQQFDEIDKAYDNLHKSGKLYPGAPRPPMYQGPGPMPHRHSGRHSVGDFRPSSRSSTNQQNFYASQRYQPRPEGDQMAQAKRRMAAQRERELRNYHQEQQYNRSLLAEMASNKSDSNRSGSPSTLSEEGRRELIARQHRALYGPEGFQAGTSEENQPAGQRTAEQRASGQGATIQRGASPRIDAFGQEEKTSPPRSKESPVSGEEGHARTISKSTTVPISGNMGPIGSRPQQGVTKRTTSPLPSSLGFGYASENERAVSQTSNPGQKDAAPAVGVWGTGSGVWGNKIGASGWS